METDDQVLADGTDGRGDRRVDELLSFRAVIGRLSAPPLRLSQNALARSMGITSGYLSQALNPKDAAALRTEVIGRAVERARQELERRAGAPDAPADLVTDLRQELQRLSAVFPSARPAR